MTKFVDRDIILLCAYALEKQEEKIMLASNEKMLKSWTYATSSVKKGFSRKTTDHTLTVTSKRIIQTSHSSRKVSKTEIPLSDVKKLALTHEVGSNVGAIILIILGVLAAILGVVVEDGDYLIPLVPIGVLFVIIGILKLNKGSLTVLIYTKQSYTLSIGAAVGNLIRRGARGGKLKVRVNNVIATEIIESLGAYVFGTVSVPHQHTHAPAVPMAPNYHAAPAPAPANYAVPPVAPAPAAPAPEVPQPPYGGPQF